MNLFSLSTAFIDYNTVNLVRAVNKNRSIPGPDRNNIELRDQISFLPRAPPECPLFNYIQQYWRFHFRTVHVLLCFCFPDAEARPTVAVPESCRHRFPEFDHFVRKFESWTVGKPIIKLFVAKWIQQYSSKYLATNKNKIYLTESLPIRVN